MAYIRDYKESEEATTTTASFTAELPTHATDDILIAFINVDGSRVITTPSGWTLEESQNLSGASGAIYTKKAASASETDPVFVGNAADTWHGVIISVAGAPTSAYVDMSFSNTTQDNSMPFQGVSSQSTTTHTCLVFFCLQTDGQVAGQILPGAVNLSNQHAGFNSVSVAYSYQKTAGAIPSLDWHGAFNDNTWSAVIAIKDDGSETRVEPYTDMTNPPAILLDPLVGNVVYGNTWPASLSLATIGTHTTLFDARATQANTGTNPFSIALRLTPSQQSSGTVFSGPQMDFGSATDLTGGFIATTFLFNGQKEWSEVGKPEDGGVQLTVRDGSAYKSWMIGARQDETTDSASLNIAAIQVDQSTDTTWASSGSVTDSAVDSILFLPQPKFGDLQMMFSMLLHVQTLVVNGGTSSNPLSFDDLVFLGNRASGHFPFFQRLGSAVTIWAPVQVGGDDPVHIDISLRTFQFPKAADGADYNNFHVDDNVVGFDFNPQAGDTCKFTNCLFNSDNSYNWTFNASASASATYDLAGTTVIGANVVLRPVTTFSSINFTNCTNFTHNAAVISSCNFTDTKVDTSDPSKISSCAFTSSGTGHAIEADTVGTFTFAGNTFTGYAGTDGSTGNEAFYNNSGGAITLNITSGGDTPTVRNGAGATTTVNNAVTATITISGLVANEYRLLVARDDGTGDIELDTYSVNGAHLSSATTLTVNETINTSDPNSGFVRVYDGDAYQSVSYDSYSGSVFTLTSTLGTDVVDAANAFVPFIDKVATSTSEAVTINYSSDIDLVGRIRDGGTTNGTPIVPTPFSGTMGSGGFSFTANPLSDGAGTPSLNFTVDYSDKIVTCPKSDTTLVSAATATEREVRKIDINDIRLEIRKIGATEAGIVGTGSIATPDGALAHNQPTTVAGLTLARVVTFINDWKIEFEDGSYAVNIVGGNSNINNGEAVLANNVAVNTGNSAGFIQVTAGVNNFTVDDILDDARFESKLDKDDYIALERHLK